MDTTSCVTWLVLARVLHYVNQPTQGKSEDLMTRTGSISNGTLRPQDLIPAFLDVLAEVDPVAHTQFCLSPRGPIPSHAMEDDDADWWQSEECQWRVTDLHDALGEAAPEGYYFGSNPGDGSDFGYWPFD